MDFFSKKVHMLQFLVVVYVMLFFLSQKIKTNVHGFESQHLLVFECNSMLVTEDFGL